LQMGYMMMAINNPKNKGMKRLLPKYKSTEEKTITCR